MRKRASKILDALSYFFYPKICIHCQNLIEEKNAFFCFHCQSHIQLIDNYLRCKNCFLPKEHIDQISCASCRSQISLQNVTIAFEKEGPILTLLSKVSKQDPMDIISLFASYMCVQFLKKENVIPDIVCFAPQSPMQKNFFLEGFAKHIARTLSTNYEELFYKFDEAPYKIKVKKNYGHQKTVLIVDQYLSSTKRKQLYQMLKGTCFKQVFELYVLDGRC